MHIHLLQFFGNGKKKKVLVDENEARNQMNQLQAQFGQELGGARPLPDHLKQMIRDAEQLKKKHKGL